MSGTGLRTADASALLPAVLEVVRALAAEAVGERAARAVHPEASLDRDVGLGSLERVELLLRLEDAFARRLPESCVALDTPRDLAQAVAAAEVSEETSARAHERLAAALPAAGGGGRPVVAETVDEALAWAQRVTPRDGLICVAGSLY
ncbi:MAG TPA: phosphopantetheine-binding protein, partial [Vicinamibacteria bacterium]|nr:phosphopantetheine-binding protein [Vicinamibacteria bacterium]